MRKDRNQGHWATMLKNCELHLNDEEFFGTLGALSTLNYAEAKRKIDDMLHKKCITKQECSYMAQNWENPRQFF